MRSKGWGQARQLSCGMPRVCAAHSIERMGAGTPQIIFPMGKWREGFYRFTENTKNFSGRGPNRRRCVAALRTPRPKDRLFFVPRGQSFVMEICLKLPRAGSARQRCFFEEKMV